MSTQEQTIEKQSPVLELPDDPGIVRNLRDKLKEYKKRLSDQNERFNVGENPKLSYQQMQEIEDSKCKIAVCEKLLIDGTVNSQELSDELSFDNDAFTEEVFNNAFHVIKDYINTGGMTVSGSTGFGNEIKSSYEALAKKKGELAKKDQIEIKKIRAELSGDKTKSSEKDLEELKEKIYKDSDMLSLYKYQKRQDRVDMLSKRIKENLAKLKQAQTSSDEPVSQEEEEIMVREIVNEGIINSAGNIRDLFRSIADRKISITGSDGHIYSPEELIRIINGEASGQESLRQTTIDQWFTQKVQDLLKIEAIRNKK